MERFPTKTLTLGEPQLVGGSITCEERYTHDGTAIGNVVGAALGGLLGGDK